MWRRLAADGPLACAPASRALIAASLAAAMVRPDDAGNVRLVKRGSNNTGRDDVAASLVLAAGVVSRGAATAPGAALGDRGLEPRAPGEDLPRTMQPLVSN